MLFVYYPCNSIQALNMGCIDAPHPHIICIEPLRTYKRCWISFYIYTVFALCIRVFITLYLAERWWWLSHFRYWSVWVDFLYTVIDSLPSVSNVTMVSKKGMAPSSLLFSTVNLMAGSTLFMCWRKHCLFLPFGQFKCHPHSWAIFWGDGCSN